MARPGLSDPLSDDGCFPGLRLVNKNTGWLMHSVDIVPPLLKPSNYERTRAEIGFLYNGNRLDRKGCGWWGMYPETVSFSLHALDMYV